MCGINGLLDMGRGLATSGLLLNRRMNRALSHRGPDHDGIWHDEKKQVFFGHRRLSIIDLSEAANQPMSGRGGTVLVFNGEIYNFRELKTDFPEYPFISNSDSEVLLPMYQRYKAEMLEKLNGMFAFALWDPGKRELLLARDRTGEKPLYYTEQKGVFAFSSEVRALLTLPWIRRELDMEALYHFLTFNKLPAPMTMFKGIHKFRPGHFMRVGLDGIFEYRSYWQPSWKALDTDETQEITERVHGSLAEAVRLRMVSDVPVGAFLSGGVDSSAVVAFMAHHTNEPITTFSVGFPGMEAYDERNYARMIAQRYHTHHLEKEVTPRDIQEFLPQVARVFDEPLSDPTSIPIYFISQMAHEHGVKVVMTGDGGDELFAGYRNWMRFLKWEPRYRLMRAMPQGIKRMVWKLAEHLQPNTPLTEMLYRASRNEEFFWGSARSFKESEKRSLIGPTLSNVSGEWDSHNILAEFRSRYTESPSERQRRFLDWMTYLGVVFVLPEYYLFRSDRLGMWHSVETRAPFMDHHLVDLAMAIPPVMKTAGGEPKAVLKQALEKELPRNILYRRKMGFCVPLKEWAGEIMHRYVQEHLKTFCAATGLLNEQTVHGRLHSSGSTGINDLWMVYFLMQWMGEWLPWR